MCRECGLSISLNGDNPVVQIVCFEEIFYLWNKFLAERVLLSVFFNLKSVFL